MGRLANLIEQQIERLARLCLAQLRRQSLQPLGQRQERVGIGRLADLLEQQIERLRLASASLRS